MITCSVCKSQNDEDNLYCTQCGASLNSSILRNLTRSGKTASASNDEAEHILEELEEEKIKTRKDFLERLDSRMDKSARLMIENIPRFKTYPVLSTIASVFWVLGWLCIIGGMVTFFFLAANPISANIGNTDISPIMNFVIRFIGSGFIAIFSLVLGFVCFAGSESMRLMMDLQENADRQSILLTLLLHRTKKE